MFSRNGRSHVHWLAPVSMSGVLLAGILLAIGHHIFYRYLDGKEVPTDEFHAGIFSYSKQQANVQIGIAFSFLVNSSFVTAISISYAQLFWRGFTVPRRRSAPTLSRIDAAFLALHDLTALLNFGAWSFSPILFTIAIFSWLMPIASIIPPGTLSLKSVISKQSGLFPVPSLDFASLQFTDGMITRVSPGFLTGYIYRGPSRDAEIVATNFMGRGDFLTIPPPHLNASWEIAFPGPYLNCSMMDETHRREIYENIAAVLTGQACILGDRYLYLSWYGDLPFDQDAVPDSDYPGLNATYKFTDYQTMIDSLDTLTLSFATIPPRIFAENLHCGISGRSMFNYTSEMAANYTEATISALQEEGNVLQCKMSNSTYKANFTYVNGQQSIHLDVQPSDQEIPKVVTIYQGIEPFQKCFALNINGISGNCSFDPFAFQVTSYQSIMLAFASVFYGTIYLPSSGGIEKTSNVQVTSLVNTTELDFLNPRSTKYLGELTGVVETPTFSIGDELARLGLSVGGIKKEASPTPNDTLNNKLEDVFQKYVVSLMGSDSLLPDEPHKENVTIALSKNVYSYSPNKLWLAYGISISVSAIIVFLGLLVMFSSGASYNNTFSTIMRSTWSARLSVGIKRTDNNCSDPLPKHLATATVELPAMMRHRDNSVTSDISHKPGLRIAYTHVTNSENPI